MSLILRPSAACSQAKRSLGGFRSTKTARNLRWFGQSLDRRFQDRLLLLLKIAKNFRGERGRHLLENFVRFHRAISATGDDSNSGAPGRDDFRRKAIRHVSEQKHPKNERETEERELQRERERVDDRRHSGIQTAQVAKSVGMIFSR